MADLPISAAILNLEIPQYSGYSFDFTYKIDNALVDLTNFTGLAQIRDQEDRLQTSFAIALGGALGTVSLSLTAAQTSKLKVGKWDLLLTSGGGQPNRLIQGEISINLGASRSGI